MTFEGAIGDYLHREVVPEWSAVEVRSCRRVTAGLSWETFVLDIADPRAPGSCRRLVAKRPPAAGPLAPYDVAKEGSLVRALAHSDVPVPEMLAWTPGEAVAGRPVQVMAFVDGDIPDVRSIERWPAWRDGRRRRQVGVRVLEVLAGLHAFDWRSADLSPALAAAGGSGPERLRASLDRLMGRIDDLVAPRWAASPVCRDAWSWLHAHLPDLAGADTVVVHGDFRVGNIVFAGDRIVAVLDWERATLGDPMQDLGFFCMPMARQRRPELMGMLLGFDDLCAAYRAAAGRPVDVRRLHYYLVYWQFVELAQILRGVVHMIEEAAPDEVRSLTSYPLIGRGTVQLVELIERFEDGDHELR